MPVNGEENTPLPERIAASGQDLARAASEGDDELLTLFRGIRDQLGNGNGNGSIDLKKFSKKHNLTTILIAVIAALGTGFGGYKVLQATVDRHGQEIEEHDAKPMHDATAKEFEKVRGELGQVESTLGKVQTSQKAVVSGLKELKQENVDSLKKERDKLERELIRERRKHP